MSSWDRTFMDRQRNADGTLNGWRAYTLTIEQREIFMGATAPFPVLIGRKGQRWETSYMVAECLCLGGLRGEDKAHERQAMAREALSQMGGGHHCGIYMLGSWEELERQWIHGQERYAFTNCGANTEVNVVARCIGGGALKIGTTGVLCETVRIVSMTVCKPRFTCTTAPIAFTNPGGRDFDVPLWTCQHGANYREGRQFHKTSDLLRILSQLGADLDPRPQIFTGWPTESYQ